MREKLKYENAGEKTYSTRNAFLRHITWNERNSNVSFLKIHLLLEVLIRISIGICDENKYAFEPGL